MKTLKSDILNSRTKINAVRLVLIFSVMIMLVKFIAYSVSRSNAILSDALESFINIATSGFTLYSLYYSSKRRDDDHPYGHGKIEYFAIGFEGALISGTGIYILIKSVYNFFHPVVIENINGGIILTALSGLAMYFIGTFLKRKGRELNSMPLIADGVHFHLDTVTSIALVAGLTIYKFTGWYWIDSALAVMLAIHIMSSGLKLTKESVNHLMDKTDFKTVSKIVDALSKYRRDPWIDIHNLRLQKFGENLHVDCHMTMPYYFSLEQVHEEIKLIENQLNTEFDNKLEMFIHTDPCQRIPCDLCTVKDCPVRRLPFREKVEWTADNVMLNRKHSLA